MTYEPFPDTPRDYNPISTNWTKGMTPNCACPACRLWYSENSDEKISAEDIPLAIAKHATESRVLFSAYKEAGFTDEQAINLLIGLMRP